jgi:hypothetical protein
MIEKKEVVEVGDEGGIEVDGEHKREREMCRPDRTKIN